MATAKRAKKDGPDAGRLARFQSVLEMADRAVVAARRDAERAVATAADGVSVCEQTGRPEDKYREFWAKARPVPAGSSEPPTRTVVLFTQYRIYRLTPSEAKALADQLHAATD